MSDPSEPRASTATLSWVAVSDVLVGLVVLIAGLARDSTALSVAGGILLLIGASVLSTSSLLRNRPTAR